ncbi:TonB-dependent receptor [uncultured Proteiniphilum sp.]|uniref:TonB-dependent receptor n=1 Tax=uncultured Proteiniphilum sp. TaxID=497637 RepID=UPI002634715A|nr:TonB-dependent receptor [uncultured Proteiniphilum sp.]
MQSDGFRENNHYKRTSLLSSGSWQQPAYTVEYTLLLIDLEADIPSSIGKTLYETNPRAAAANWNEIKGYKEYQRAIGGITVANRLSSRWNNRLTLFGRWVDSYERRPFNNLDDGTSGGGIRNKLTYHADRWNALLGLEWMSDAYRWQMDLNGELINKNRERRGHTNLFGMVYWRPDNRWNISVGGAWNKVDYRLTDQFPANGDQSGSRSFPLIFSPRIGVNYAPSPHLAFYASSGHGFSMPSPEETLLPEGDINESIKPEQGMQYEAGIRLNLFNNATRLEASVYRIDLDNLLVTKRATEDIFTGINAGETRHTGVELMLQQRIFHLSSFPGSLHLSANYTYSRNQFIDFEDDGNIYNGNRLPGVPSSIARESVQWQPFPSLQVNAHLQHVGPQYIDDANTVENDGYFLTDLKITYLIPTTGAGSFELFIGMNNLTNTRYSPMLTVNALAFGNAEPRYYYPGMPRHYFAGINWRF